MWTSNQLESENNGKSQEHKFPLEQCKDMVFDSALDAKTCYKAYAWHVGFDKSLIGQSKQKDQEKTKQAKRTQSETKIGCKAMMRLSLNRDIGKWVVAKFITDHNHELYTPRIT
ncbi:hypothetical protein MIMGU_mgv1a022886mg, partial [Erythranthe guttata]